MKKFEELKSFLEAYILKGRSDIAKEYLDNSPQIVLRLLADRTQLREALDFYAKKCSWGDIDSSNMKDVIESCDLQEFRPERKSIYIGGLRARQALAKSDEVESL